MSKLILKFQNPSKKLSYNYSPPDNGIVLARDLVALVGPKTFYISVPSESGKTKVVTAVTNPLSIQTPAMTLKLSKEFYKSVEKTNDKRISHAKKVAESSEKVKKLVADQKAKEKATLKAIEDEFLKNVNNGNWLKASMYLLDLLHSYGVTDKLISGYADDNGISDGRLALWDYLDDRGYWKRKSNLARTMYDYLHKLGLMTINNVEKFSNKELGEYILYNLNKADNANWGGTIGSMFNGTGSRIESELAKKDNEAYNNLPGWLKQTLDFFGLHKHAYTNAAGAYNAPDYIINNPILEAVSLPVKTAIAVGKSNAALQRGDHKYAWEEGKNAAKYAFDLALLLSNGKVVKSGFNFAFNLGKRLLPKTFTMFERYYPNWQNLLRTFDRGRKLEGTLGRFESIGAKMDKFNNLSLTADGAFRSGLDIVNGYHPGLFVADAADAYSLRSGPMADIVNLANFFGATKKLTGYDSREGYVTNFSPLSLTKELTGFDAHGSLFSSGKNLAKKVYNFKFHS